MKTELIDKLLSTRIPGGSEARDWFLPHEQERGLENVREVVRLMIETYLAQQEPVAWLKGRDGTLKWNTKVGVALGTAFYTAPPTAIPEGYVLVPKEPTQEILDAMQSSGWMPGNYKAMLAAGEKK